jgi:hypothetical protein
MSPQCAVCGKKANGIKIKKEAIQNTGCPSVTLTASELARLERLLALLCELWKESFMKPSQKNPNRKDLPNIKVRK